MAVAIFFGAGFGGLPLGAEIGEPHEDFYARVPRDQALAKCPQFVLLDDFNTGKLKTSKDDGWQLRAPRKGKGHLVLAREDGRNPERGYSLKVKLKIQPSQGILLTRSLNHLDISQASALLLRIKLAVKQQPVPARSAILYLSDRTLRKVEFDITPQLTRKQGGWTTVTVPMKFFRSLDLDQLLMLSLKLWTAKSGLDGNLWLDEITFFGEGDLNFESSRDNILGFPERILDDDRRRALLSEKDDYKLLLEIARDTWNYFLYGINRKTQLVVDNIKMGDGQTVSGYTSPTNIAMDLMANVAAMDLGFLSREEALYRTRAALSSLMQMKRHRGFFFNFYETKNLMVTRSYVSSVDNGWLAISLVIIRQAFKAELWNQVTDILETMNFDEFYDTETNQIVIGYEVPEKEFGGSHYGMLVSEARAMSILAIGKGDVPEDHWWFLFRTPPAVWKWQNQVPRGRQKTTDGHDYFQGYYESHGKKFVPSWGGSLFEYLMPTLVLDEKKLAPEGLGLNGRMATELHRDYALQTQKYPVWGISPAGVSDGRGWRYYEMGIKELGVKGYPDRGVVTPHVSFLALDSLPKDAILNLRKLLEFPMYGSYGFYDTWDVRNERVNTLYLALDQGMSFIALCNYLKKGSIQARFGSDPIGKKGSLVLLKESFFKE